MNFTRTLSDVGSGDGSLSRTIGESSLNSSTSGGCPTSLIIPMIRPKTPLRANGHNATTPSRHYNVSEDICNKRNLNRLSKSTLVHETDGDRFIPCRVSTDMGRAQHAFRRGSENSTTSAEDAQYRQAITESLNTNDSSGSRILRYASGVHDNDTRVHVNPASPFKREVKKRAIPTMPEKVLDAPEIIDDFYLNILDWSHENMLAIALNQEVYLWNASSGDITRLMSAGYENEYVTSLKWSPDSPKVIAIGSSIGRVQLWDVSSQSLIRTMRLGGTSAAGRVPTVTWREHLVTSGSRSGHIRHHDTRVAHHEVGVGGFHTQEVCGLAWSPDKRILASGANDNFVALWSASDLSSTNGVSPMHVLRYHQAAVKALAWCPWKPNLLCSGGGTVDHSLCFWNATSGSRIKSVDVSAQVSGVVWNTEFREILTSHGGPKNQLVIWQYPEIRKVTDLMEHQGRVICVTNSPNNEMIASCAADETLRIWHCFEVDKFKKREQNRTHKSSVYARGIR